MVGPVGFEIKSRTLYKKLGTQALNLSTGVSTTFFGVATFHVRHPSTNGRPPRADLRFDRGDQTLRVLGFWWEDGRDASDRDFAAAMARGLKRLKGLTGAEQLDLKGVRPTTFRAMVAQGP